MDGKHPVPAGADWKAANPNMIRNALKICMVSHSNYLYDGRIHRYSQSLIQHGHWVDMIGLGFKRDAGMETIDGVRVYRIHPRDFGESGPLSYLKNLIVFCLKSFFHVTRLHLINRYDVIHFHNIPDFGVFATWAAKCMGAKILLDIHDLVPEFYMRKFGVRDGHAVIRMLRVVEKLACRFADRVITVTDLWKTVLEQRSVDAGKCEVIMNCPLSDVFNPLPYTARKKEEPFHLSYHGNLAEQTGVDILIDAMHLLRNEAPGLTLQIIGEGRMETSLKAQAKRLGLEKRIAFLPVTPVMRLPERMHRVYAGVDPKRSGVYAGETLSVKSMEYLGMRIPLIVSRTQAADFYFRNDEVAFFKPGDASDLARTVLDLVLHEDKRKRLHEHAARFNERYNWNMMEKRYLRLIQSLVRKK